MPQASNMKMFLSKCAVCNSKQEDITTGTPVSTLILQIKTIAYNSI